ncbi:hypothetical protein SLEP1_g25768 [Rubroshorea leprosula]|uniref:Uncharacterized protein n=1 Tax=Rubroshorea leprosula TaxID=152421 RepID=A0AAV5JUE2_9ROSI|nr:hypothetical protein SLEP1_g25768 [Rubroshorea leprosula]
MEGEESEPIPVSRQHIADAEMAAAHTVSDSDDSDSSDSENEAEQAVELQNLQSQLSTNPSNYDAHIWGNYMWFVPIGPCDVAGVG